MPSTEPELNNQPLHVAVGVIEQDGQILITRRAEDLHQGGKWEFPGGKMEAGESVQEALARELEEELGICPESASPLIRIPWKYHDRHVLLDVWRVDRFSGTPQPREGQPMSWVTPDQLEHLNFPAANIPIIRALGLPDRLLVTPEPDDTNDFLAEIEVILKRGIIKLVLFRARSLEKKEYNQLVVKLSELASTYDAGVMLYWDESHEQGCTIAGRHLTSTQLMAMTQRHYDQGLLSAACHSLQEIEQANRLGVDFIFLSPVQQTLSHPDAIPLGWAEFQALVDQACMPVYALGGLSSQDLSIAKSHGAQGIAAIRSLWNEPAK